MLRRYKFLFFMLTGIMALIVVSPVLQKFLVYPQTEYFTELWLLGPEHNAEDYPYNIKSNNDYNVFLGVANHLASDAHYVVEVKFRNQTQSAPDSFNRTHSSLASLYNLDFSVAENETWEMPLDFSFDYSFSEVTYIVYRNVLVTTPDGNITNYLIPESNVTLPRVNFHSLKLNDITINLQGFYSDFDNQTKVFFGNLVFELWIYNTSTANYVYHERYVDLKFNMTSPTTTPTPSPSPTTTPTPSPSPTTTPTPSPSPTTTPTPSPSEG
jgi:hypothetical protein